MHHNHHIRDKRNYNDNIALGNPENHNNGINLRFKKKIIKIPQANGDDYLPNSEMDICKKFFMNGD